MSHYRPEDVPGPSVVSSGASTSVRLRREVESENVGWDITVTPAHMVSVGVELLQRKKCIVNTAYNQSLIAYLNK